MEERYLLKESEALLTSWADSSIRTTAQGLEKLLVEFFNPDLKDFQTPVTGWPFQSLLTALTVSVAYLMLIFGLTILVKSFGSSASPKNDKLPKSVVGKFKEEPVLVLAAIYNLTQVVLCAYMVTRAVLEARKSEYSFICNKFDRGASGMAEILWVFYMSKVLDFCDTVFIVLRKKWRQLSFLHVYHHSTIFLIYWLNLNAGYDGDIYYTIALNSSIHFIMYGYYLSRTFNIKVPTLVKMFITNMQLIQFVTMIGQAIYLRMNSCAYPKNLVSLYFVYILTMIALFTNFKKTTYAPKTSNKPKVN